MTDFTQETLDAAKHVWSSRWRSETWDAAPEVTRSAYLNTSQVVRDFVEQDKTFNMNELYAELEVWPYVPGTWDIGEFVSYWIARQPPARPAGTRTEEPKRNDYEIRFRSAVQREYDAAMKRNRG